MSYKNILYLNILKSQWLNDDGTLQKQSKTVHNFQSEQMQHMLCPYQKNQKAESHKANIRNRKYDIYLFMTGNHDSERIMYSQELFDHLSSPQRICCWQQEAHQPTCRLIYIHVYIYIFFFEYMYIYSAKRVLYMVDVPHVEFTIASI